MSTPAGRVERPAVKKAELVIKTGKGLPRPRSVVPTSDGIIALEHVHWLHPLTTGNGTTRTLGDTASCPLLAEADIHQQVRRRHRCDLQGRQPRLGLGKHPGSAMESPTASARAGRENASWGFPARNAGLSLPAHAGARGCQGLDRLDSRDAPTLPARHSGRCRCPDPVRLHLNLRPA
jgi:hypothetical protein